jgi:hypothetical protein
VNSQTGWEGGLLFLRVGRGFGGNRGLLDWVLIAVLVVVECDVDPRPPTPVGRDGFGRFGASSTERTKTVFAGRLVLNRLRGSLPKVISSGEIVRHGALPGRGGQ